MLFLSITFVFISILLLGYFILLLINSNKLEMIDRMTVIENLDKAWVNQDEEYGESLSAIIFRNLGGVILKFSPSYKSKKTKMMLEKAGILRETTTEKWLAKRAMVMAISSLVAGIVMFFIRKDISSVVVFAALANMVVFVFYRFTTAKKITRRTHQIIRDLPYSLDLITVSVEAGLSLDGAIGRIVSGIKGPLSEEFGKTLKEMRMGIEKKEALSNMAKRIDNRDLSMILSSIVQADELGVSLGKILRIEGAQLREKRKQSARERAMKAPVKILFPLVFFIFPTIFLVLLGPTAINLMDVF
jgi:tight adherence protein C